MHIVGFEALDARLPAGTKNSVPQSGVLAITNLERRVCLFYGDLPDPEMRYAKKCALLHVDSRAHLIVKRYCCISKNEKRSRSDLTKCFTIQLAFRISEYDFVQIRYELRSKFQNIRNL